MLLPYCKWASDPQNLFVICKVTTASNQSIWCSICLVILQKKTGRKYLEGWYFANKKQVSRRFTESVELAAWNKIICAFQGTELYNFKDENNNLLTK